MPRSTGQNVVSRCRKKRVCTSASGDRRVPTRSGSPRRNLYLTYNRAGDGDHRERYFADKRKSFPPVNEREAGRSYAYRV